MSIKISVVIGTFNQKETLQLVLSEYEKQTLAADSFEIVVVDSTSTDGSIEHFQAYQPTYPFTYHVQKNNGKVGARNKAAELAQGNIILVTDGDMIPDPGLLQAHVDAHAAATEPTCFEGYALNMDKLQWPITDATCSPQVGKDPAHLSKLGWYYFLTGNCSILKDLFMKFGGFNMDFQGYGWEDLELGYRLEQEKVPLRYLKTAKNYHYHVISEEKWIDINIQKGKSAQVMLKLHPELKWFLGLNPISRWAYRQISPTGKLYTFIKQRCYHAKAKWKHEFGYWFLKEYNYLQGALSKQ